MKAATPISQSVFRFPSSASVSNMILSKQSFSFKLISVCLLLSIGGIYLLVLLVLFDLNFDLASLEDKPFNYWENIRVDTMTQEQIVQQIKYFNWRNLKSCKLAHYFGPCCTSTRTWRPIPRLSWWQSEIKFIIFTQIKSLISLYLNNFISCLFVWNSHPATGPSTRRRSEEYGCVL